MNSLQINSQNHENSESQSFVKSFESSFTDDNGNPIKIDFDAGK